MCKPQLKITSLMQEVAKGLKNPKATIPQNLYSKELGDRSTYVGASSATGCLRKAYLDVKEITEHSMEQVFVFERGHQLEEMIRKGLNGAGYTEYASVEEAKGLNLIHQLEVKGKGEWSFIKAHLDFVFTKQKAKELIVTEIKSSASIPDSPYDSHLKQINIQMFLLRQQYPDYSVRGQIVYHNWDNGKSTSYEVGFTRSFVSAALGSAKKLWISIQNDTEPEPETQLYCSMCPHKGNCPALAFGGNLPEDLKIEAEKVLKIRALEKEAKKIKNNFKSMLEASGLKSAKVGNNTIKIKTVRGKKVVPMHKLKKEHRDIYDELLEESGGYSFVQII